MRKRPALGLKSSPRLLHLIPFPQRTRDLLRVRRPFSRARRITARRRDDVELAVWRELRSYCGRDKWSPRHFIAGAARPGRWFARQGIARMWASAGGAAGWSRTLVRGLQRDRGTCLSAQRAWVGLTIDADGARSPSPSTARPHALHGASMPVSGVGRGTPVRQV